jgi:PX domain
MIFASYFTECASSYSESLSHNINIIMVDAQISIPNFILNGKTAYYNVCVIFHNTSWKMQKRYSDFVQLYGELAPSISSFPELPPKKYIYIDKQTHYEDRKVKLEKFLYICCSRTDIANTSAFCKFMQFDLYISNDKILAKPLSVSAFKVNFTMGVTQTIILGDKLITLENIMQLADKAIETIKRKSLAQVKMWQLGNLSISQIWELVFPIKIGKIEASGDLLYVGTGKGELHIYKIKDPPELQTKIQMHNGSIRGIVLLEGNVVTIGEDGKLGIYNPSQKDPTAIAVSDKSLTNIVYESSQRRLFISDSVGSIVLYSTLSMPPLKLESVPTGLKTFIRCMAVDFDEMIIFAATDEGIFKAFKYDNNSTHPKFEEILLLDLKENIRSMHLLHKVFVVAIGNQKGVVRFYSYKVNKIIYNIPAHKSSIKAICSTEREILLSSKDKSISRWLVPK